MKLILFTLLLFGFTEASSAQVCDVCQRIDGIFGEMKKVKPNPVDPDTIEKQDKIVGDSEDILKQELANQKPTQASTRALVNLVYHTIPYDNSRDYERNNMPAFQKTYYAPNSLLKTTLDEMAKEGKASAEKRKKVLEAFGINPNSAANTEKKSPTELASNQPCPKNAQSIRKSLSPSKISLPQRPSASPGIGSSTDGIAQNNAGRGNYSNVASDILGPTQKAGVIGGRRSPASTSRSPASVEYSPIYNDTPGTASESDSQ